jgi:hypothetical protein
MGNFTWTSPAGGQFMNHTIGPANEIVNHLHPLAFPGANGCSLLTDFARRSMGQEAMYKNLPNTLLGTRRITIATSDGISRIGNEPYHPWDDSREEVQ